MSDRDERAELAAELAGELAGDPLASVSWRYMRGGKSVHGFARPPGGTHSSARCGSSPVWYNWRGWQDPAKDEQPRIGRDRCRRCVRLLLSDRDRAR